MKFKWLVALVVILAFVWVCTAAAGPRRPAGGDPDIWERAKINNPNNVPRPMLIQSGTPLVVDFQLVRVNVPRQDAKSTSAKSYVSPLSERPVSSRR